MNISDELREHLERLSTAKNTDIEQLLWALLTESVIENDFKRQFFQLSHTMLCVLNTEAQILSASPPLLRLCGYRMEDVVNTPISTFIHDKDYPSLHDIVTQSDIPHLLHNALELRVKTAEHTELWTGWHIVAVDDDMLYFVVRDISKEKEIERSLRDNEAYYKGILESEIELVCRYLPDTTMVYANQAYCDYFNITEEEIIGKSFIPFALPENHKAIYARIADVLKDPSPLETITFIRGRDGTKRTVQWIDYGIEDEQGKVIAIQAVGRDITRLQRAEEELAREREIVAFRQQLIDMVSHEFRTPLTVIQTSAELLKLNKDRLGEEQRLSHLEKIDKQVQRLIHLLDDVLILGKTDSKNLHILAETINIRTFFKDLISDYALMQPEYKLSVTFHTAQTSFRSGKIALDHIFYNLISNAVRYSIPGSQIMIDVWLNFSGLSVEVTDEGIGIPKEEQDHIFDTFYRASNVKHINGTGLGLRIVKQYVDLHRGDIFVHSILQHGTTFSVWLPAVVTHQSKRKSQEAINNRGSESH